MTVICSHVTRNFTVAIPEISSTNEASIMTSFCSFGLISIFFWEKGNRPVQKVKTRVT